MPMAYQEHLKEKKNNKNRINLSLSLVETGVPGEKPLQAKLRADYFSLSLFPQKLPLAFLQTSSAAIVFMKPPKPSTNRTWLQLMTNPDVAGRL